MTPSLTLCLVLLGPPPADTLYFAPNDVVVTADAGATAGGTPTVLGTLYDTNVARFTPGVDASAVKLVASGEIACLLGDDDGDGDFWEIAFGDLDALGVRRYPGPPPVRPTLHDLVLSAQDAWADADEANGKDNAGALDGTLFSLRKAAGGGAYEVVPFLPEWLLLRALGQPAPPASDGVDVDAFVQDADGNLFLSFRVDEVVGQEVLGDGGVVCLPRARLVYDEDGNVVDATPKGAVIVLGEANVDVYVGAAGLLRPNGLAIGSVIDLQALALDPAGGSFPSQSWIDGLGWQAPNLLFNGQGLGPSVLTTAATGPIARVNGMPLATSPIHGGPLGLDPASTATTTADLNALLVLPAAAPRPCLDVTAGQVDLALAGTSTQVDVAIGGLTPGGTVAVLVTAALPFWGAVAPSVPAPAARDYPDLYGFAPGLVAVYPVDAAGRLLAGGDVAALGPGAGVWLVVQAVDLEAAVLTPPASVWIP